MRRWKLLEALYAVLAVIGLGAVGAAALRVNGNSFVDDVFANPATRTVTLDLLVLGSA